MRCTSPDWCDESSDCGACWFNEPDEADPNMAYDPDRGWMFRHELGLECNCSSCQELELE